jgi:hypothetical protein
MFWDRFDFQNILYPKFDFDILGFKIIYYICVMTNQDLQEIKNELKEIKEVQSKQMNFTTTVIAVCVGSFVMGLIGVAITYGILEDSKLQRKKEMEQINSRVQENMDNMKREMEPYDKKAEKKK